MILSFNNQTKYMVRRSARESARAQEDKGGDNMPYKSKVYIRLCYITLDYIMSDEVRWGQVS